MLTDTVRTTKRRPGAQLAANLNFNFSQVVRQHTVGGCGGIYYMGLVYNLLLFPMVKEFCKSVKFRQSYRYQLVVHFLGHSVVLSSVEYLIELHHLMFRSFCSRCVRPCKAITINVDTFPPRSAWIVRALLAVETLLRGCSR